MAEIGRGVRLVNVAFGVWLAFSPLLVVGGAVVSTVSDLIAGMTLIALALLECVRDGYGTAMPHVR